MLRIKPHFFVLRAFFCLHLIDGKESGESLFKGYLLGLVKSRSGRGGRHIVRKELHRRALCFGFGLEAAQAFLDLFAAPVHNAESRVIDCAFFCLSYLN